jgi:hypothetical protein
MDKVELSTYSETERLMEGETEDDNASPNNAEGLRRSSCIALVRC